MMCLLFLLSVGGVLASLPFWDIFAIGGSTFYQVGNSPVRYCILPHSKAVSGFIERMHQGWPNSNKRDRRVLKQQRSFYMNSSACLRWSIALIRTPCSNSHPCNNPSCRAAVGAILVADRVVLYHGSDRRLDHGHHPRAARRFQETRTSSSE